MSQLSFFKVSCEPFFKWAGGKRKLIKHYDQHFRTLGRYEHYIEPFVGGGALYFHYVPEKAILSDSNIALINVYRVVRDQAGTLINELKKLSVENQHKYLHLRNKYNNSNEPVEINPQHAAMFLMLNYTGFNGLFRVNSEGKYNVPYGKRMMNLDSFVKKVSAAHEALQGVELMAVDFREHLTSTNLQNAFVFLDPPYLERFADYTSDKISHLCLVNAVSAYRQRGAKIAMSYSDDERMYQDMIDLGFYAHEIPVRYIISKGRRPSGREYLYTSF